MHPLTVVIPAMFSSGPRPVSLLSLHELEWEGPQATSSEHSGLPFHSFVWPRNLFSPGMHVPVSLFPGNWFQRVGTLNYC